MCFGNDSVEIVGPEPSWAEKRENAFQELEQKLFTGKCIGITDQGVLCHTKVLEGLLCTEHYCQRKERLDTLSRDREMNFMVYNQTGPRLRGLENRMSRVERRAGHGDACVIS
jgi:hypothetical protein